MDQQSFFDVFRACFFQFLDGYKLHVAVFAASGCEGRLCETSEAAPIWTDMGKIPYDEMWQDDAHWYRCC